MVLTLHVFRKSSLDGKLSLYVGQRDFIDHLTHVDHIEGVVVIEEEDVQRESVYVEIVLTYRYGREDDEVMGLTFAKEIVVSSIRVYPQTNLNCRHTDEQSPSSNNLEDISPLQVRLMKKVGEEAHPFTIRLPKEAPASVTLQPGVDDHGKPCGVQWELRAFAGSSQNSSLGSSHIRMRIRLLKYSTEKLRGPQPLATCSKEFLLSPGKLELQVTLDRQVYCLEEAVSVRLRVMNGSQKQVKRLKVSLVQLCDVSLGVTGQLRHTLTAIESQDCCPVMPGASLDKTFVLTPSREGNESRRGLAIQCNYQPDDPSLAPSTPLSDEKKPDAFGVVVSYLARVKLSLGGLAGDMATEVPFTLVAPPLLAPPPPLVVPQLHVDKSPKGSEEGPKWVVEEGQGPAFLDTEPADVVSATLKLNDVALTEAKPSKKGRYNLSKISRRRKSSSPGGGGDKPSL